MRAQLLPSTFDAGGRASARQHLTCFIIDNAVAFDAGSLAMACETNHYLSVRDIVLSHAHLDHIAGLPLFIDDLFASLTEPIRIHAAKEVIEVLERDIFNWSVYPRFSELRNDFGPVVEYRPFQFGCEVSVAHLSVRTVPVNHKVPSSGFIISDGNKRIAMTGDTSEIKEFWDAVNKEETLDALIIECAFPDELSDLADISHHLTPSRLRTELAKFQHVKCPIYIANLKPMYRDKTILQISELCLSNVEILEVGRTYEW